MTYVKICGTTNLDDALCAVEAGTDLLGFIFYPKSPRSINIASAQGIVQAIRSIALVRPVHMVGVFVNASLQDVLQTVAQAGLDFAQLHGDEPPALLHQIHTALGGRVYKALKASGAGVDDYVMTPAPQINMPSLLLDANHPNLYGGSGLRADESIAAQVARRCDLLLAGGLTPDNVGDAIRAIQPWGVDVASGVESTPGRKAHAKVRAFIHAVRQTSGAK